MRKIKSALPPGGDRKEFVMSDAGVDRMGDVIDQAGWDLSSFHLENQFNPIALFNHKADQVVGSWEQLRVENDRLIGKFIPLEPGTSELADSVRKMIEQNVLRAVSVGFEPIESELIEKSNPRGGRRFKRQTLLECSIVSVPANPRAVAIAKSLNISHETISRVFGEHAETRQRDITTASQERAGIGEHAVSKSIHERSRTMNSNVPVSQRIEMTQGELNTKRDQLQGLNDAAEFDDDAAERVMNEIKTLERSLRLQKEAEAMQGNESRALAPYNAPAANAHVTAPAVVPRRSLGTPLKVDAMELLTDLALTKMRAFQQRKSVEQVMHEEFGDKEALKAFYEYTEKAATAPAKTTVTGWAVELVAQVNAEWMPSLLPASVYPRLSSLGMKLTFGRNGIINIPTRSATPTIAGSFVGEGAPIPVRQAAFTSQPLVPKKMGVITVWTREMDEHSAPAIGPLLREEIQRDTAGAIDAILLDTTDKTTIRPAGLRYGVAGLTATTGGGFAALVGDIKQLTSAIMTATNGNIRQMVFIMNPAQALSASFIQPPNPSGLFPFREEINNGTLNGYPLITSGNVPAGVVICMDAADYVSITGDSPRFDVSDHATIHMEDTTPLNIGTAGSPATVAAPTISMFQTDSMALRMVLPMNWIVRRTGVVAWTSAVTW